MKNHRPDKNVTTIDQQRDDPVGRLLDLADSGPEIPVDGASKIKAAIRPIWQEEIRHSRRWLWIGGLAASMLLALFLAQQMTIHPGTTGPVAALEAIVGEVEIEEKNGFFQTLAKTNIGNEINPGSWIQTNDNALASLRLSSGHSLRIDSNSRLRVDEAHNIFLKHGGIYLASADPRSRNVEVHTAFGIARDIGTQFEVRATDNHLQVSVRRGLVEVDRDKIKTQVPIGRALRVHEDGSTEVYTLRADAKEWAWIMKVAPPFDIEGQTVAQFLEWIGKETGLSIRFIDAQTEKIAASTVLHGGFEGLSPAEAPELVMPATGLSYEIVQGTMIVTHSR